MKAMISNELIQLAKKITIYQGYKGTDKQVERTLKGFKYSLELMNQYATNRIK